MRSDVQEIGGCVGDPGLPVRWPDHDPPAGRRSARRFVRAGWVRAAGRARAEVPSSDASTVDEAKLPAERIEETRSDDSLGPLGI